MFNEKQGRGLCWAECLPGHRQRQRSFQQDSCVPLTLALTITLQGHQPLSQCVSSKEHARDEGPRGPCSHFSGPQQKLRVVEMGARGGGGGLVVMIKDLCTHLGVRDESHTCWPVRAHSLLRETGP